jgi:hypothetical protein
MLEIETLGALSHLRMGVSLMHTERWCVRDQVEEPTWEALASIAKAMD